MRSVNYSAAMRRELSVTDRIPYGAHVSAKVVRTSLGDFLQTFRLGGAGFQTSDDEQLNNWHERLNVLWRNIASPHVALWTHIIRRAAPISGDPRQPSANDTLSPDELGGDFGSHLQREYRRRVGREALMQNELYLSIVYRPVAGLGTSLLSRALTKTQRDGASWDLAEALDACEKLAQTVSASLARYEPECLGCYEHGLTPCSSLLEFLALLVNGEWQRMPLRKSPLNESLASGRLLFGTEAIEYRSAADTRVGAMLGIKEYPTPTSVGMYNGLLSAPLSFVMTQSFAFLTKASGQVLLQRQFNRMANAGDFAVSQAAELTEALDALTSNEFVMGDHHFSLQVMASISDAGRGRGVDRLKVLNDGVALARSLLADTGMLVAREDLALEAAFWAQLPGNFPMRPRKAPITSRNFAAMAPFHNFPMGRPTGNHWGDALALLITSARSPYFFSLHASDPADPDGGSRKDTGHTLICGPTGSGKTVFIGFMIAMLSSQGATQVIFDKDRGLEILVRALDGEYFPLKNGVSTGFNPLQLPPTPGNVEFLKIWLQELCVSRSSATVAGNSVREQADLDQALRGTLALDLSARRLSRLVEFLDPTAPEGLHARLSRWCESCRGDYAWVFDNAEDTLASRLAGRSVIGFDVTEFLDHPLTRPPITLYLFHLVRQLLDGRRLVCWMDEFWRLLADPAFESFAKDGPKTWRKLNGVMCLATQSASDVLESPISRTLIEQTPTKIFFPNADANFAEYTEGFGLSTQEFQLLKEQLEPGSRMFLVKQSHHSVVCQLDLKGFDRELAVISGRASEVSRMNRLMVEKGSDPTAWLPDFMGPTGVRVAALIQRKYEEIVMITEAAMWKLITRGIVAVMLVSAMVPAANAQWAVVDAPAIVQLIQQVQEMDQEVKTAESQLNQAKQALATMTGDRGMEYLLSGVTRNYLPTSWSQLTSAMSGGGAGTTGLSAGVSAAVGSNAVLTPQQLSTLSPDSQRQIIAARQSIALQQALAQSALANSSARFTSIQSMISAISSATDQKGILDLQARISGELGMLQNEQTKLQVLHQATEAQTAVLAQQERESVIAGQGNFATRFQPAP